MKKIFVTFIVSNLVFTGCGKNDSTPAPGQTLKSQPMPKIGVAADANPAAADASAPVASPRTEAANAPIVPGSSRDPNVLPPGFVPKPTPREYVVNGQVDLKALTEALRDYCMWKKAVPQDLNELVTSKYLPSLPTPPAGKKFVIKTATLEVALSN